MDLRNFVDLILLGRPQFIPGGFLLYCFGAGLANLAGHYPLAERFVVGYAVVFLAHLSISYSNEYFDSKKDVNGGRTFFSGGTGILIKNPAYKGLARSIAIGLTIASLLVSLFAMQMFEYGAVFFGLALIGNFLGWAYSAPPIRLVDRRLGELAAAIAVGFLIPGTGYYAISGSINADFIMLSLPLFFYGIAFILSVESPDIESDKKTGKKTFASIYGLRANSGVILICVAIAGTLLLLSELVPLAIISLLPMIGAAYGSVKSEGVLDSKKSSAITLASIAIFFMGADIYLFMG
jgi:1,4-dihydroxy-2-naphthoate octaprenyltransferase